MGEPTSSRIAALKSVDVHVDNNRFFNEYSHHKKSTGGRCNKKLMTLYQAFISLTMESDKEPLSNNHVSEF